MNNNNNLPTDGPLDVSGEYTPITKQKIQQVDAARWHEMSMSDLYDQKTILDSRYLIASQIGNASLAYQIQMGIQTISALISQKSDKEINLL